MKEVRRKKQLKYERKQDEDHAEQEAPHEQIKTGDVMIQNYEVDYQEEDPDIRMLGGLRGIKALKVQREYMKDVEVPESNNKFAQYEERKE